MKKAIVFFSLMACVVSVAAQSDVKPVVVPQNGNNVVSGGTYKAKIVPVSEQQSKQTRFFINGKELKDGVYTAKAGRLGKNTYAGYMLVGNDTTRYPFSGSYSVGEPSCGVQNVEAQYLYRFVGNKFMISVPGFTDNQVSLVCQNAEAQKQGKFWMITPTDSLAKTVRMEVFAPINGQKMPYGSRMYKVIDLHPYALLLDGLTEYGKASNQIAVIPRKRLNERTELQAYLPNTDLYMPLRVKSFVVRFPDGQAVECTGNKLSPDALRKVTELSSGDVLVFQSIVADGAGSEHVVHPLAVILK